MNLPVGQVLDQIACWQIAECGEKEKKKKPAGSLMQQMAGL